jgi:Zn-dependent oligopeptidase
LFLSHSSSYIIKSQGKYGHAAIFHLVKHNVNQGAVDCMLCNLPASTDDRPSLLRHGNVVTFFHEFGHIVSSVLYSIYIYIYIPENNAARL